MINDEKVIQAVSSISQRAERQRDIDKVVSSYIDVGILPQLLNNNNQILYGRRGTGKTHILKMYENFYEKESSKTVCYIDCRILGSSPQFSNAELSLSHRCSSLFSDILEEIHDSLLNHIAYQPNDASDQALNSLSDLESSSTQEIKNSKTVASRQKNLEQHDTEMATSIGLTDANFQVELKNKAATETEQVVEFNTEEYQKIVFPDLHYHLKEVLKHAETELLIVIDEWSAIPIEIQPYLAEFLKKSFIPIPEVTIKIGALEYRTNFTIPREKHNYVGFELGSDISTNLDIDDYYIYDKNPEEIVKTFQLILFGHITSELPDDYFENEYSVKTPSQLLQKFFSGSPAFVELVRASEGVVRDFINIFNQAFFSAKRKGLSSIDKKTVIEAGRQWFENDKSSNLDQKLHLIIRKIVDEVIGEKKARSFLVSKSLEKHPVIEELFDARVIHLVKKGYSDKDNPGVRYNIYSLDYGTYVDLLNTTKQPDLYPVETAIELGDTIVPFDDKRSIRRIILSAEILN